MNNVQINLIYFGRIAESKNVDVIIKVLSILVNSGLSAKLDLIGGYSDEYKKYLDSCRRAEGLSEEDVVFHGAHSLDYISKYLNKAHYFIFPSQEKKEGHSNSLTEAMAFGVVPIVSNAGFNESICGDLRLVVYEFSPQAFAQRIMDIEQEGVWQELSQFVYKRVIDRFTEMQAIDELKKVLHYIGIGHKEKA